VTRSTGQVKEGPAHEARTPRADPVGLVEVWRPTGDHAFRGPERVLLERGQITETQLRQAIELQKEHPRLTVLETLVQTKVIDEMVALQAVATYFKLPFMRLNVADVDVNVMNLLPVEYLKAKRVIPITRDKQSILLGIADPADIFLIDDLKRRLHGPIRLVVTPFGDIMRAIEELSASPERQVDEIIKGIAEDAVEVVDKPTEDVTDLEKIAGESPVIRYVNYLISSAVREDASDIHIEPSESCLRVRCRIDGVLFEQQAPPCLLYTSPSPRDGLLSRMPSSA